MGIENKTLGHPDTHHLLAAQGWFELGNHLEANKELDNISPALRSHPGVLDVRWQIYAKVKQWEACVDIGEALVKLAPGSPESWLRRSVAFHGLRRFEEAAELLLPAVDAFPKDWRIRYDLACYACLLGNNEEAWNWLEQAFDLGGAKQVKLIALEDPDLEKFWVEIRET
ncbi:MAG: hypothetical protein JWM68_3899 [Verrucomicrobiales bacterium]|nr:hypothetical protein [Verrucomicrobiales bacterium]